MERITPPTSPRQTASAVGTASNPATGTLVEVVTPQDVPSHGEYVESVAPAALNPVVIAPAQRPAQVYDLVIIEGPDFAQLPFAVPGLSLIRVDTRDSMPDMLRQLAGKLDSRTHVFIFG